MVKVVPASEEIMKHMRHGVSRVGFTAMDKPVDWPDDTFTARRIRDGDVKVFEEKESKKE